MSDLIQQAADKLGYPAGLVERSARARAQTEGVSMEEVLTAWLGGDAMPAAEAGAAPETTETTEAPAPAAERPAAPEPAAPQVEVLEPDLPPPAAAPAEAEEPEQEEDLGATWGGLPRWLAASFMILPSFALLYALVLPNGPECGTGGVVAVDPVTGEAVGCDGNPYGIDIVDYFALGDELYAQCASCHGGSGLGSGNFPALAGGEVLTTFPAGSCEDHVTWVSAGSLGWPEVTGSNTYGATDKPVGGSGANMPAFGASLTDEELRSVVLYERVAFGGQTLPDALADCGLEAAAPGAGVAAEGADHG